MSTAFFDTSILLYSVGGDPAKARIASALLRSGGHISAQVCNEFAHVALLKMQSPYPKIRTALEAVFLTCEVHALTLDTHLRGLRLAERFRFAIYDAIIVASALDAACETLYSEDFQHGMKIENRLTIRNPFRTD